MRFHRSPVRRSIAAPTISRLKRATRGGGMVSWTRLPRTPSTVALLVLAVYGAWLLGIAASGHDVRDFISMGRRYAFAPHAPPLFAPDPGYRYAVKTDGYDGQFAYYIALHPVEARLHLDRVDYRYTRIIYPMTARILALGQAWLIPSMLIAITWLAAAAGTFVLALWLARRQVSPWLALIYGLSPALFICLQRDLEEPLAYALVALAMYLYADGGRHRLVWSGLTFAVALLTRESTAIFPAVLAAWLAFHPAPPLAATSRLARWREPAVLLGLAFAPLALYKAFLLYWLGPTTPMLPDALYPRLLPLSGLFSYWPWHTHQIEVVVAVVAPALICAGVGVWALWKRVGGVEVWLLLANVQLFVVMLNRLSYENVFAAARIATGVMLAALLCIPTFDRCTGRNRIWLSGSTALWFVAWPSLVTFSGQVPSVTELVLDLGGAFLLWLATHLYLMGPVETVDAGEQGGSSARERSRYLVQAAGGWCPKLRARGMQAIERIHVDILTVLVAWWIAVLGRNRVFAERERAGCHVADHRAGMTEEVASERRTEAIEDDIRISEPVRRGETEETSG